MDTPGYDVTGRSAFERNLLALEQQRLNTLYFVAVSAGRIDPHTMFPPEIMNMVTEAAVKKAMEN